MSADPWFSISGIAISYVFLIVLGVAIVATCSSMLAFIACCDCIDCNMSHDTSIVDTSIMIINDDVVADDNNDEDESKKKPPSFSLICQGPSNQKPHLNESKPIDELFHRVENSSMITHSEEASTNKSCLSNQTKIETEVCVEPNAGQRVISESISIDGTNENYIQNKNEVGHESLRQHRKVMFADKRFWRCHPISINPDSIETEIW